MEIEVGAMIRKRLALHNRMQQIRQSYPEAATRETTRNNLYSSETLEKFTIDEGYAKFLLGLSKLSPAVKTRLLLSRLKFARERNQLFLKLMPARRCRQVGDKSLE